MKRSERKLSGILAAAVLTVLMIGHSVKVMAQEKIASIHGRVLNTAGQPLTKGEIRLSTDRSSDAKSRKYLYTFPISQTGEYKGTGITPNTYVVFVFQDDKSPDFNENVNLVANTDLSVDFDMSRKEYLDKMTPEEKKALEEYKKKNSETVAANSKIANLNTLLLQARADNKSGNYEASITAMQQATTQKPDEAILWITLADAQLGSADTMAKAAKAAGKPATDPEIVQKYTDATVSYKKAVDLNAASKKPSPEVAGAAYNQLGQAYAKMGDVKNAFDAYESAAKAQPPQAGSYYFNEAVTMYNASKMEEAAAAADKAIAADPKRADAYYIKGQALITKASVDKAGKIVTPPGCVDAYQTYLELAPAGSHAEDVKGILTGVGEKVKSSYKAGKK